jgi:crotonobetainyl-CoA:carnitine CoA-transferase CaiB-like acyl-CoA transferase
MAPLDGITVLDLTRVLSGPYCTMLLADMGARVIKIEQPKKGDDTRAWGPPFLAGESAYFLSINRNKESVTLDFKHPQGRAVLDRLLAKADVVVENFRPGTLAKLGLGYASLAKMFPRLIYCSVSGFGQTGPRRAEPGYDAVMQGEGGLMSITGAADGPPYRLGVAIADIVSGMFAAYGVAMALVARERSGRGQQVDIAMLDATVAMTDIVTNFASLGKHRLNEPKNAILDPFRAADGWFVMQLVREHQLERISQLVGHPEWPGDPRLATREGWAEHLDDMLRPAIEAWASSMTRMEAVEKLSAAGIAAAPIQTAPEVVADPHLQARNMLVEMERSDGVDRPVIIPGNPVKMSKVAEGPELRVPWVGEHTRSVLAEELGLDDDAIDKLVADGVITD